MSARARRVRLVMTLNGLEVVVPRGFGRRKIPELVESRRGWIERATARIDARRRRLEADPPRLPQRIVLRAVGEEWEVQYRPRAASGVGAARSAPAGAGAGTTVRQGPGRCLVVTGDHQEFDACKQALCRWLSRRARLELVPRLAGLARRCGLGYVGVSIRQQRTRWGSCSRRKTISLNAKLLFMPAEAVDYVLLHELCHTVEMNHSLRFWRLVQAHDPEYRVHKRLVKAAAAGMPTWLDHELEEPAV